MQYCLPSKHCLLEAVPTAYQGAHHSPSKNTITGSSYSLVPQTSMAAGQLDLQHTQLAAPSGPDFCTGCHGLSQASGMSQGFGLVLSSSVEGWLEGCH
jgi:hypothetical protein